MMAILRSEKPPFAAGMLSILVLLFAGSNCAAEDEAAWQAGTASVVITPEQSMWMAGYASRDKPSEGKVHNLYAKALALEDAEGTRLVIVTTDLIGIPRPLRENLQDRVGKEFNLPPESLLLNASHTHCGPELRATKASLYDLGAERVAQAREYIQALEDKLVKLIGDALADLEPATVSYTHARAGFAMNRRLPSGDGFRNHPNPDGPVDHDVPVLRIDSPDGKLKAVLFGYACHNTTLSFYQFCGDYAGFAQHALEEDHPGITALFFMGCGGDQNPYPRRDLEHAKQHGRHLANAVETSLMPPARPLNGPLRLAYEEVTLEFAPPPTREDLLKLAETGNRYDRRKAAILIEQLDTTGRINSEYSYPVQVVRIGDDLTLVALAGEVVVDYSLRLKRELKDPIIWIAGYSNDVFGYVPSVRVLKEGGYEGGGAMRYTTLPGPFAESIEERIVAKVHELVRRVQEAEPERATKSGRVESER